MDSSESPVHGEQGGSAYNGHFESVCYHPLFLFNSHGDCLAAKLRPGNVHSAEDWDELLLPEIERQQAEGKLADLYTGFHLTVHAAFPPQRKRPNWPPFSAAEIIWTW